MDYFWQKQEYHLKLAQAVINLPFPTIGIGNMSPEDLETHEKLVEAKKVATAYILKAAQAL